MAEDLDGLTEDMKNLLRSRGLDEATINNSINALRQPRRDEGTENSGQKIKKKRPRDAVEQLAVSPDERRFTVNGSIDRSSRGKYFFVKLTETNSDLYKKVYSGDYVMLHGPRSVGKSTRMLQACDDLASEFHCMNVSLHDVDTSNVSEFWKSLSLSLVGKYSQLGVKQVESGPEFSRMWNTLLNPGLVSDKKFVLFVDEFDSLVDTPGEHNASILGTLRGLKQSAETHRLHCVVIVGVFSIVRLNTKRSSPFNVGEAVAAPFLTLGQVNEMFGDYLGCRGFQIDAEVINDIYERTGGHAGLVNLCGKAIDEEIRPKAISKSLSKLTLPAWLETLRRRLKMWLIDSPTVKRIVTDLKTDGELQASCRKALREKFLCRDAPVPSDAMDIATLDYLKSVGMVQEVVPREVVVSNSMVRMLAIWYILPCDRRDMSLGDLPVTREYNLDMLSLLLKSTQHFPVADLCGAVRWSFKRAGRGPGRRVPHEYYYQSQLASLIRVPRD